jgi:hypothetical protein
MTKPKMSLTPTPKNVDEFISAAGQVNGELPWNDPKVREDIYKLVSLRLSEPYVLKLQWISEQTKIPQQKFLREWLLPLIDEEIERIQTQVASA